MNVQFYKNLYSGYSSYQVDSWQFVIDAIKNPQTKYTNREDIPLWSFYVPIDTPSVNKYGEPNGCADNMRQLHALQIDFDDNVTRIEDFCTRYKDTTFYLYTSFRHSEEHHKFRVIIPLDATYGNNLFRAGSNKELLLSKFEGCDKSTINSFRKQRIPALDPYNPDRYRFIINEGKLFSLPFSEMVRNYNEYMKSMQPIEVKYDTEEQLDEWYYEIKGLYVPKPNDVKENTRKSVMYEIDTLPWGSRGGGIVHYTLAKLYGKLRTAGFSPDESVHIMMINAPHDASKEISDFAKLR